MPSLDYFLTSRSVLGGGDDECGDTGIIREFGNRLFIGIVDVLGHGRAAHKVAVSAMDFLEKNYRRDLTEVMEDFNEHVKGSSGLVAGLCHLNVETGALTYVGIGNITVRKFGSSSQKIVARDGIVGYMMPRPKEDTMKLHDGDVLVLHTDGVKEHFELADYPELLADDAETIARRIVYQFGKEEDDAACIALRYKT